MFTWFVVLFSGLGTSPEAGVPDMTVISDIDELGINRNLQVRYDRDQIYVSFSYTSVATHGLSKYTWRLWVSVCCLWTGSVSTDQTNQSTKGGHLSLAQFDVP